MPADGNHLDDTAPGRKPPSREELAWEWLRHLIHLRLAEPTPERKAIWFYQIEAAERAFLRACGEGSQRRILAPERGPIRES